MILDQIAKDTQIRVAKRKRHARWKKSEKRPWLVKILGNFHLRKLLREKRCLLSAR